MAGGITVAGRRLQARLTGAGTVDVEVEFFGGSTVDDQGGRGG